MKRILSAVLSAVMLIATLAIPVFAAGIEDGCEAYVTVGTKIRICQKNMIFRLK